MLISAQRVVSVLQLAASDVVFFGDTVQDVRIFLTFIELAKQLM